MKLVGIHILEEAKRIHPAARSQLDSWIAEIREASWITPHELKERYATASILKENRVVFNIKGNHFRLLTLVNYIKQVVLVSKFGTHEEYMEWD